MGELNPAPEIESRLLSFVGVEGFEPPHPKDVVYSHAQLSSSTALPLAISWAGHTPCTDRDSNPE